MPRYNNLAVLAGDEVWLGDQMIAYGTLDNESILEDVIAAARQCGEAEAEAARLRAVLAEVLPFIPRYLTLYKDVRDLVGTEF